MLKRGFLFLGFLAIAACSGRLKSSNASQLKPVYHKAEECPVKSDLPQIGYIQDLKPSNNGEGVILSLSNDKQKSLQIMVDGRLHSETFFNEMKKDGTPDYQTLVYRAGCHDKGISAKFFVGNQQGSWELTRENGGYQFTNTYGGQTIDSKFYKNEKKEASLN